MRKERGWNYAQLARESGIDHKHVTKIEKGKSEPCLAALQKLAAAFGMTVAELLNGV